MLVTLTYKNLTAVIDSLGAQLVSLKDSGREYMWQGDPNFWSGCSPLLFPAIGNSRSSRTIFDGRIYDMPKHGFCRSTPFQITRQTQDTAVFTIQSSAETKSMYPYDFSLSLTYSLSDDGLSMDYEVQNLDTCTISYCIGAHPGFNCPMEKGSCFEDYQLELECEECADALVYNIDHLEFDADSHGYRLNNSRVIPLDYRLFYSDAVYFTSLKSRKVSLIHKETRKGVEVSYPDFQGIAFWTPAQGGAPFLCIEPWNGSAIRSDEDDEFIHKFQVQILKAGQAQTYHLGIRII